MDKIEEKWYAEDGSEIKRVLRIVTIILIVAMAAWGVGLWMNERHVPQLPGEVILNCWTTAIFQGVKRSKTERTSTDTMKAVRLLDIRPGAACLHSYNPEGDTLYLIIISGRRMAGITRKTREIFSTPCRNS